MRSNAGFTLIEMAITLVIIGIIAMAAVPRFYSVSEDADAETLRAIVRETEMALSAGVSRGLPYSQLRAPAVGPNKGLEHVIGVVQSGYEDVITLSMGGADTINVAINSSGSSPRSAVLTLQDNGSVRITTISNFPSYSVNGVGDITK
jgi:prepilin-type N-terminal cleavage/methylation domain-containing protein